MEGVSIPMHLIGYNERGFIGFMEGGTKLCYVEADESRKKSLPYIDHQVYKEFNVYSDEHPEVFKQKIAKIKSKGGKK